MGLSKNSYEKKAELDAYPYQQLLAAGVPDVKFYHTVRGLEALCPFHNDKTIGSFVFNPNTGLWGCFACGESGQGVISLIMRLNGWDFLKALDYLYERRNSIGASIGDSIPAPLKRVPGTKKVGSRNSALNSEKSKFLGHDPASAEDRHLIYQAFAEASPLSERDWEALRAERRLYRSTAKEFFRMPAPDDMSFWERFRELLHRCSNSRDERLYYSLIGVPGFYWDEREDRLSFVSYTNSLGMLLHSPSGKNVGIDIRVGGGTDSGARYIGFSSGGVCERDPGNCSLGTKIQVYVDVVPRFAGDDKGIAITEGKFKAIQLSYRGYTALSVRGVGNWKHIPEVLPDLPAGKPVSIAFDADCRSNPAVARCASRLGHALLKAGYETQYLTWSACYGKGFDDLCGNGFYGKCRVVPAEKFLETTLDPFLKRAGEQRKKKNV